MAQSIDSTLLLPAFCRGPVILRAIVLAQAVAIILAFAPGALSDPWLRLGFISLFVQWVTLMTSAVLCVLRPALNRLPSLRLGVAIMAILLIITACVSLVSYALLARSLWLSPLALEHFLLQNILLASIIGLMAIQFFMLHIQRQQGIIAQSRAELLALQARIQPHFLFNSLNTVAELTQQDANAAEQAILDLAAVFRAAMHAGDTISLSQELTLARQYLSLEQWRLGARLNVQWQLPEPLPELNMPALTIQPLLENAIRHGIEGCVQGGIVSIELVQSKTTVTLLITNPVGDRRDRSNHNGVALANIAQRLQLFFGTDASLSCNEKARQFRVKLVLPKQQSETRE
ncbi:sensor histidine kinase [Rheinheimera fenheensis]|uniref:sensor histidine kinase n=1 Tax=Rheinheimera fenheensis TaxID=3152295 RepID=UPI00325ECF7A